MVYNPLLVIDWRVVSLDDPRFKGVADGNVVITRTGSIMITVKTPAAGSLTALQVAADAKTVTVATTISVVAARETVTALKFADGNTDYNGTVNFGPNPVKITAFSAGMTGSSVRVTGIEAADLAFANPDELSPLGGSLTATAATAAGAAVARGIDAAVITVRTGLATNFTVSAAGGKNQADATVVDGSELRFKTLLAGAKFTVNAVGGRNGDTVCAAARGMVSRLADIEISQQLSGAFKVTATGGIGTGDAGAEALALSSARDIAIGETLNTLRISVSAVGGQGAVSRAAGTALRAAGEISVAGALYTFWTIKATGGKGVSDAGATASAIEAGSITVGGAFSGTLNVSAQGGKVTAGNSGSISADATARAVSTASGVLRLGGGFTGIINVTATAGSVIGGAETSAAAVAHGFWAGTVGTGQLEIAGAITGSLTVKAAAANFSQTVEAAARAVGFGASGTISLGEFTSGFRLTVNAVSIQNADGRALRGGDTVTIARLDGNWTIFAKGGGTFSSGCAAAHAFTASKAITVAASATTLKVTLSTTGGNATLSGNAFTDSRVFYSLGGAVNLTGGVAGAYTIAAASNKAINDSYSLGYFISALGVSAGDFDRNFKLKITTRGGTSYNGDAHASSYGIFGGTGALDIGALAGNVELTATGGVGSAAAIAKNPPKVAPGSAAANAIGLVGKSITLSSVDPAFKIKLTAKAGISAVSSKTKNASAESRVFQAKDGSFSSTGTIGGIYVLAASGGGSAAGSVSPGYREYAAANAIAAMASATSISFGNFAPKLNFTARSAAGSAGSKALATTVNSAEAEASADAATTVASTDGGDLAITLLAGIYSLTGIAGSANANAVSEAKAIDMNAVAVANANATGTGFSGGSVTLNQVDSGLRIVIAVAAGKAVANASKLVNTENKPDSGTASATASAYATASGICAESGYFSVASNQFNGLVAVTARGGIATANGQSVTGNAVAGKSYGIYSAGAIHGADAARALVITKVIAAAANTEAYAIFGNGLNITVNGALYAGNHTNAAVVADALSKLTGTGKSAAKYLADALKLNGKAYAVKGGSADDTVSFGSGSIAIGNIDLGGGVNTLSLTHQSQLCGDILSSDGGTLNLIINIGGESSVNPIITVGSDAGKTLGGASVSILIGAARLGSYILVKNGGDFASNTFTVNGVSLEVGREIRLANGTYVSLHIDSKKQLIFTAGAGHNPYAASDSQLFGTASADPAARQLLGGAGDDLHLVRNSGDTIAENAGGGTDTVAAGVSYSLGDNLENLFLHGRGDLDATGNAGANRIAGNAGKNILDGGGGDDTFIFSENWGHDLVRNDGGSIELFFTGGLRADDLTMEAEGDDLVVTAKLTGDTIRVEDWALNAANSIRFGNDLYFDNYLLRSELGCFATLETLSEQSSTKNASLAS
ncbi:MAG: beta strand repeat-containing protein [Victivallaceae bacterium]